MDGKVVVNIKKWNKMSLDFEPTLLGVAVYVITVSNINEGLQTVLITATIVYTIIKINQLLKSQKKK